MARREFWAVQVLVAGIAVSHLWLEWARPIEEPAEIYLVPTLLYLIPVVYAAVTFGLAGSLPTALWSATLILPNVVFFHDGLELAGEVIQIAWVVFAGVFVGLRVNSERAARIQAEERERARRASEDRYRAIFDAASEPIVLLDEWERIGAANPAAARLLKADQGELVGLELRGPIRDPILAVVREGRSDGRASRVIRTDDPPAWLELVVSPVSDPAGRRGTQVLIRDVTASQERERGLEAVARLTLVAREEEQRRIARELHDGPIQSLMQLWRQLDALIPLVPPEHGQAVADARRGIQSVADQLRRSSRDLRPSVLDDLGIVPAVRAEAHALIQRSSLSARVSVTGGARRLDPVLELALLRITQEALRNVERHANASSVSIRLAFRPHGVRLTISDDGRGFDRPPTRSELLEANHLGIVGMQERARLAGASLTLRARPRGGLVIEVESRQDGSATPGTTTATRPDAVNEGAARR